MLGGVIAAAAPRAGARTAASQRPSGRENPIFDTIRQTYLRISDRLLGTVDDIETSTPEPRS